ncbi:phosphoinositide 3-kinase regulatory subunit 5-like isoform 1-T3 [Menidia menidia]
MMEQSSCTEDRITHLLERCLCHLAPDSPGRQLWNAGLCISRWCLEELVKRDPHNFLILLRKILWKTKEVLEQSQYELVVPLTLLFSSALLGAPHVDPGSGVLQEACRLFGRFLSWPEPCSSACRRLLDLIQQELRAPGISFHRLVRTEQAVSRGVNCSKTILVLMLSADEDDPPEVRAASERLSAARHSGGDIATTLILHSLQAALGGQPDLQALHAALQGKRPEELQRLLEEVTDSMETASSAADHRAAREALSRKMRRLRDGLRADSGPADRVATRDAETFKLPVPKCHACSWDSDTFDVLRDVLAVDADLDPLPECFLKEGTDEDDNDNDTSVDEEESDQDFQSHRASTASSSSRDSGFSGVSLSSSWSVPSGSSGVESDPSEDLGNEDSEEGKNGRTELRKKPKKKSKSFLGMERFSLLFKSPGSPRQCRRVQSMGHHGDAGKEGRSAWRWAPPRHAPAAPPDALSPQKHPCVRRRPILSCDEGSGPEEWTLVKVVVFGGDREAGRLARAYSDLQQKEAKCPQLTRTCKLQFYFVPTKRRSGSPGGGHTPTETQTGSLSKSANCVDLNHATAEDDTTGVAQMLSRLDPWYERNVLSLLSLSSDVLCQAPPKDEDFSVNSGSSEHLPLLADLVLYYCRKANQPILVQLYQAELTLAGGERRKEVFIHSLELGHTAGTRAVKAMRAASKRFGIDEEREAVPLNLSIAYNKVAVSGRSQWIKSEKACTSVNLLKACRKPEHLDWKESLQMTMTEVLKRQCSKSKKGYNQHISVSEAKVDKVRVIGDHGTTFAVCLDQDEKKFIQSVTRCEVSLCCKPGSGSDWKSYKPLPGQIQPLNPSYYSLLCLPITSFSASCP